MNVSNSANVFDVCDYIISRTDEAGYKINVLKLHKLLFYCQAWSLAFECGRLFDAIFQAWIHGPVCPTINDRFSGKKQLYSSVELQNISQNFNSDNLTNDQKKLINIILESYAQLTNDQLEEMTHRESPWNEARNGLPPDVRCENIIKEETMKSYYSSRISNDQ